MFPVSQRTAEKKRAAEWIVCFSGLLWCASKGLVGKHIQNNMINVSEIIDGETLSIL